MSQSGTILDVYYVGVLQLVSEHVDPLSSHEASLFNLSCLVCVIAVVKLIVILCSVRPYQLDFYMCERLEYG